LAAGDHTQHMDHASLQESLTKIQDIAEKINQRRVGRD
jgi:hypothetical protein